jgi:integrase
MVFCETRQLAQEWTFRFPGCRAYAWAIKSYRLTKLEITPHRRDTIQEKTADEQIKQFQSLFAHPDMTVQDRLMAALILVFGQPTHKVVALRWSDITIHDGTHAITLGEHPVILEPPLDATSPVASHQHGEQ